MFISILLIILTILFSFYLGYILAKRLDNNHHILFKSLYSENEDLRKEVEYWSNLYHTLYEGLIEEDIIDCEK